MKLTAIVVLAMLFTGCSSNKHIYNSEGKCITCWNNPVTGEPINHDGNANQEQAANEQADNPSQNEASPVNQNSPIEHEIAFSVPVDVDIAYLKIKKEFNYFSEQEIRQEWGSMASAKMQTFAFAYEATPSVFYHMRADRQHDGVQVIIDNKLEKLSAQKSKITITYWLKDKNIDPVSFGTSLKRRARQALNL